MNNLMTYIQNGDYLIPDLKLSQQPEKPLGKYGRMRKTYLKEHRPILYNQMLLSEKLYPHLLEIDETAQNRLEQMIPQLAKEAGATEELKASDPMKWVGLMNTCILSLIHFPFSSTRTVTMCKWWRSMSSCLNTR